MNQERLTNVSTFWTKFDLATWTEILTKTSEVVTINQDRSLSSRKDLALSTKTFRQRPVEDQLTELGKFVKKYQVEVDGLTARALYAENAFQKLSFALNDAPDPASVLQVAKVQLPKISELKKKNKVLTEEVKELEKEFDGLSNQDITIRELQLKIASLENGNENKIEGMAAQHLEELEIEFEEKTKVFEEEKLQIEKKVHTLRASEIEAQTRADIAESHLFAVKSRAEESVASLEYDVELLTTEMKRKSERCIELEMHLETTSGRNDTDGGRSLTTGGSTGSGSAEDPRTDGMRRQQEMMHELRDELVLRSAQLLRANAEAEKWKELAKRSAAAAATAAAATTATAASSSSSESGAATMSKIAPSTNSRADATDIEEVVSGGETEVARRERALHAVHAAQEERMTTYQQNVITLRDRIASVARRIGVEEEKKEEDGGVVGDGGAGGGDDRTKDEKEDNNSEMEGSVVAVAENVHTLVRLLDGVERKYERETTSMRNELKILKGEMLMLRKQREEDTFLLTRQAEMIVTLERELESVAAGGGSNVIVAEIESASVGQEMDNAATLLKSVLSSTTTTISTTFPLSIGTSAETSARTTTARSTGIKPAAAASMVNILTAQRDRYRERVHELEKKLEATTATMSSPSSFSSPSSSSTSSTHHHAKSGLSTPRNIGDYDRLYKENLRLNLQVQRLQRSGTARGASDMEKGFRGRGGGGGGGVKRAATGKGGKQELNAFDKTLHGVGRLCMMNKFTRLFLFGYIALIHLVLFLTLHNWSHSHHLAHLHHPKTSMALDKAKFLGGND